MAAAERCRFLPLHLTGAALYPHPAALLCSRRPAGPARWPPVTPAVPAGPRRGPHRFRGHGSRGPATLQGLPARVEWAGALSGWVLWGAVVSWEAHAPPRQVEAHAGDPQEPQPAAPSLSPKGYLGPAEKVSPRHYHKFQPTVLKQKNVLPYVMLRTVYPPIAL